MERIGYSEEHLAASKRLKETKDCTVMAWANCFDSTYEKAHSYLKQFGRPYRRGMFPKEIEAALRAYTKAKVKFGPYNTKNRILLKDFVVKHPQGRYYVLVRGHALCVKDGVVYDHSDKPRRQITFAARVYLEGEI